jgi:hypothetical protein
LEVVEANLERLRYEPVAYLAEWLAPYFPAPIFPKFEPRALWG